MILDLFIAILLFLAAFLLVVKGGDFLVNGAIWMAKVTKVPEMIIGATVVSVATTLPEILVSTIAALEGSQAYGIAIGNAAGSIICNGSLILGIVMLFSPSPVSRRTFMEKGLFLLFAAGMFLLFSYTGGAIVLWEAIVLLAVFAGFMIYSFLDAKRDMKEHKMLFTPESVTQEETDRQNELKELKTGRQTAKNIIFFVAGAAMIAVGARLLVDNGMKIADILHFSKEIMGLTFVAIGTSLPELVTSITAVVKKKGNIGLGNIIGANIINCTVILGLCGVIAATQGGALTISMSAQILTLPYMMLSSLLIVLPTIVRAKTSRMQGLLLTGTYLVYIVFICLIETGVLAV